MTSNSSPDLSHSSFPTPRMKTIARQGFSLLVLLVVAAAPLAAQENVRGQVTSAETQAPLAGVVVRVQGTENGVLTNAEGVYTLSLPADATTLVFSSIGYEEQRIPINGRSVVDVALETSALQLDELVVVGYTTQQRRNISDAVASVSAEQIENRQVATLTQALKGQVAGVNVTSTGEPGEATRVIIRGVNFMGSAGPLYVVDGMYTGNNPNLNPEDIASLEVLKDASAASQYGARAANGVIVITTKKGSAGTPKISVSSYYGMQEIPTRIEMAGAEEWAAVARMAAENAGREPPPGASTEFDPAIDTDWQGALYQRGAIQSHDVAVSGGSENASYRISGGYLNQDGALIDTGFERYALRVNSQISKGRLQLGENIAVSRVRKNNLVGSPLIEALRMPPSVPLYDSTTTSGYGFGSDRVPTFATNPVGQQMMNESTHEVGQLLGNVFAELGLLDNLSYRFNLGFQYNDVTNRDFSEKGQLRFNNALLPASLWHDRNNDQSLLFENLVTFNDSFGAHGLNAVLGYTEQIDEFESLGAFREEYTDEGLRVIDAGTSRLNNRGGKQVNTLRSYLARVNYAFDDRYLLTGSIRRDGSSRFGPSHRWGNFLAGSVGWVVSEEGFYESIPLLGRFVDYLKLRASHGNLGDQDLGNYEFAGLIEQNRSYVLGPNADIAEGAIQINMANPNIRWQAKKSTNFGADLELFDSRLALTADYYIEESDGMLAQPPLPSSVGARQGPFVNLGSFRTRGFELGLTHRYDRGDFQLNTSANLTTIDNEVLALGNNNQPLFAGPGGVARTAVGGPVGAFYLWETDGIFQSEDEVQAHTSTLEDGTVMVIQPKAVPGDVRYVDQNQDGLINDEDRRVAGSPFADLEGGLFLNGRFRSVDFSLGLRASLGREIYNDPLRWTDRTDDAGSGIRAGLQPWTPEDPSTTTPRAVTGPAGAFNGNILSDRWLEDGSYLRVQNIELGYTLPESFVQQLGLLEGSPRIYLNLQNLYTFTDYSSWDPEVVGPNILASGVDTGDIYPNVRTMSLGVDIDL